MADIPSPGPVKVVLIDTRYVKADPRSFKSVVQSLTGKDSCVAWVNSSSVDGSRKSSSIITTTHKNSKKVIPDDHHNIVTTNNNGNFNIDGNGFSRGMSFKDTDRMLLQMPPLEDLQYWLSD